MAWEIDASRSQACFSIRQTTVTTIRRCFGVVRGYLHIDAQTPVHSWLDLELDAPSGESGSSIGSECGQGAHRPSSEVPDAERDPLITFTSTRIEHIEGAVYTLAGNLTVCGVERPITFDTLFHRERNRNSRWRTGLFARTKINRAEFGHAVDRLLETLVGHTYEMISIEVTFDLFQRSEVEQGLALMAA